MSRSLVPKTRELPRPVFYSRFNEAFVNGAAVNDVTASVPGTITGGVTTGVLGRGDEAFSFDGVDGQVSLVPESLFDFDVGDAFSISVMARAVSSTQGILFGKSGDGGDTLPGYVFELQDTSGKLGLGLFNTNGGAGRSMLTDAAFDDGDWHLFVATYDGTNTTAGITLYVDGITVPQTIALDTAPGSILNNISPAIGSRGNGVLTPRFFDGDIQFVCVHDLELTQANVEDISARAFNGQAIGAVPPVSDYAVWWSARNVDGLGNTTVPASLEVATLTGLGTLGKDAVQASAAKRPLLRTSHVASGVDGYRQVRPGVRFDGIDDLMTFAPTTLGNFTILALIQPLTDVDNTSAAKDLLHRNNNVSPLGLVQYGAFTGALTNELIGMGREGTPAPKTGAASSDTFSARNLLQATWKLAGKQASIRYGAADKQDQQVFDDGVMDGDGGLGLIDIDVLGGQDTGARYNDFILHELLVFERALSETEVVAVENFLAQEYPGLDFQRVLMADNPGPSVDESPAVVNVEANGDYPEPNHYWSMDNADVVGSLILDSVGGVNGTINGATTGSTAAIRQSFSYNGSSNFVSLPTTTAWGNKTAFTVSIWVKPTTTLSGDSRMAWSEASSTDGNPLSYVFLSNPTGDVIWQIRDDAGTLATITGPSILDNDWHHIALVQYSKSSRSLFVDGIEEVIDTTSLGVMTLNTTHIGKIERFGVGSANFWHASIDETALWDRGLTQAEITAVLKQGQQHRRLLG